MTPTFSTPQSSSWAPRVQKIEYLLQRVGIVRDCEIAHCAVGVGL